MLAKAASVASRMTEWLDSDVSLAHPVAGFPVGADRAGYYSTAPLEKTLTEFVVSNSSIAVRRD